MTGPVIHVGIEKAASSFLQKEVFPALEGYAYRHEFRIPLKFIAANHLRDVPAEIVAQFRSIADTRTAISREGLITSRYAHTRKTQYDSFLALSNLAEIFGTNCRLLVVIRRQDSAIDSMIRYKQRFLSNPRMYFVDFPVEQNLFGAFRFESLTGRLLESYFYCRRILEAVALFGKDRITIAIYEDLENNPSRFFAAIGGCFGEDLSRFADRRLARVNAVSSKYADLPERYIPMGHVLRKLNVVSGLLLEKFLPGRSTGLTGDQARELRALFRQDNQCLAEMFDLPLQEYGYF